MRTSSAAGVGFGKRFPTFRELAAPVSKYPMEFMGIAGGGVCAMFGCFVREVRTARLPSCLVFPGFSANRLKYSPPFRIKILLVRIFYFSTKLVLSKRVMASYVRAKLAELLTSGALDFKIKIFPFNEEVGESD
jgi:hypothetical protein